MYIISSIAVTLVRN